MSTAAKGFIEVFVTEGPGSGGHARTVRLGDILGTKTSDTPNFSAGLVLANGEVLWVQGTLAELNRKLNAAHAEMQETPQTEPNVLERLEKLERRVAELEALVNPEGTDNA